MALTCPFWPFRIGTDPYRGTRGGSPQTGRLLPICDPGGEFFGGGVRRDDVGLMALAALHGPMDGSPGPASVSALARLRYREIWAVDFEFQAPDGERPEPVCMVARELRSGRLLRFWRDELLALSRPPFGIGADALFVAYYASAELGCFLALGWPMPLRILDLFAEFRATTNGLTLACGKGLLGALQWHDLNAMGADEKTAWRDLVLRGGPWSGEERRAVLDYCQADVDALDELLPRLLPTILGRQRNARTAFGQALLRGRYMAARPA